MVELCEKDLEIITAGGAGDLLLEPPEVLVVMNLLEAALTMYNSEDFDWKVYRKLILDAGSKIMEVKEGDC